jgi:hypothetical protein
MSEKRREWNTKDIGNYHRMQAIMQTAEFVEIVQPGDRGVWLHEEHSIPVKIIVQSQEVCSQSQYDSASRAKKAGRPSGVHHRPDKLPKEIMDEMNLEIEKRNAQSLPRYGSLLGRIVLSFSFS